MDTPKGPRLRCQGKSQVAIELCHKIHEIHPANSASQMDTPKGPRLRCRGKSLTKHQTYLEPETNKSTKIRHQTRVHLCVKIKSELHWMRLNNFQSHFLTP